MTMRRTLALALLAAAPAAAAPERITPAGADGVFFDGASAGHVYASAGDSLVRQAPGGAPETVAAGGHFQAEAAGGTVVSTLRPLVAADHGSRSDDLYLIGPGGPVLLSAGVADDAHCGATAGGAPAACFAFFGSTTPDGQGVAFTSDAPVGPEHSCSDIDSGGCSAYLWRDGAARQINADMDAPEGVAFNPDRAYATDDGSTVFLGGLNARSTLIVDPMAYYAGPGGVRRFLHRGLLAAAADRRSVLLQGFDADPAIARWDGTGDPVAIAQEGTFLGASPDLSIVYYATDDGLHVDDHGTDRRLGGTPVDAPDAAYEAFAAKAVVSPDGARIAYGVAGGQGYEIHIATAAGADAPVATGPGLRLTGFTGDAVSFTSTTDRTCDDTDHRLDTYVQLADGTSALGSPGTAGDSAGQVVPGGDVVYRDDDGLWRATPKVPVCAGGTTAPKPSTLKLTAKLRGKAPRACGRKRCGRHARLTVTLSRAAKVTVTVQGRRLLSRKLKAGRTALSLPYVPRALKAGRRYTVTVRAAGAGDAVTRKVRVRVR